MKYHKIEEAVFISRPNRFIANVQRAGESEAIAVHVKNTGRCRELLVPGATVYIEEALNKERKTPYDLVAVEKNGVLFNMDSQAPNAVVKEWLNSGKSCFGRIDLVRPEKTYGKSRFDFYMEIGERKIYLEVKGVTLEEEGVASFPDAPTQRGVKHVEELIQVKEDGMEACLLFVVQMKGIKYLQPNDHNDPDFGDAIRRAQRNRVTIIAYDCIVRPDELTLDRPVEVRL